MGSRVSKNGAREVAVELASVFLSVMLLGSVPFQARAQVVGSAAPLVVDGTIEIVSWTPGQEDYKYREVCTVSGADVSCVGHVAVASSVMNSRFAGSLTGDRITGNSLIILRSDVPSCSLTQETRRVEVWHLGVDGTVRLSTPNGATETITSVSGECAKALPRKSTTPPYSWIGTWRQLTVGTDDVGTMAERCPPPRSSEALAKVAALNTEWTLDFLRRQLAIKSDVERICFNAAIVRYADAVESLAPAYYDALEARATYNAAIQARKLWFAKQTDIEESNSRSAEYDNQVMQTFGTAIVGTAIAPAALVATALSAYRIALANLRDLVVLPPFHEGLYQSYRTLRAQHDSVEAFDIASSAGGSAYHLLVQQMVPLVGAQKLSGEERSRVLAQFWRTRFEARYAVDQVIAKGPPTAQINAALAPARRCIGGFRQEVAKCVQEATSK